MMTDEKKYAVFTMDVESFSDTECVGYSGADVGDVDMLDGLDEYIKILEKHGIKATMFTVCGTAERIRGRLMDYIERGHKIALHGYDHTAPLLLDDNKFKEDIFRAKCRLEQIFGTEVCGYRAPCFSMDNNKLNILKQLGFKYDSSRLGFEKARHNTHIDMTGFRELLNGVFCRDGFFEFGLSCQVFFGQKFPISGGGYVRLSHWGFIKNAIDRYLKSSNYYVFYLHPFELSRQKVPKIDNLKMYDKYYLSHGLSSYPSKIEAIILSLKRLGYTFVTFEELTEVMATA
ncbi:MAG: polysaccharide deacetylase family protein [Clostridia bacterium]|nr:polysaccharide deacetylase family protein [Clostridia bacterium]